MIKGQNFSLKHLFSWKNHQKTIFLGSIPQNSQIFYPKLEYPCVSSSTQTIHSLLMLNKAKKRPINVQKCRLHGNIVVDGWAEAIMQKPLGIKKCDLLIDQPTDMARCVVACPRLKRLHHG